MLRRNCWRLETLIILSMIIWRKSPCRSWRGRGEKNPDLGYAPDFVSAAMAPNLEKIAKQGVKIISNAGGVNPLACAKALEAKINALGLSLRVACITGDDLLSQAHSLSQSNIRGMFDGLNFPEPTKIASINIYSGAFSIARALDLGADIVITGTLC